MVRVVGIEPTLLAEPDFESGASTSFTTPAQGRSYNRPGARRNSYGTLPPLLQRTGQSAIAMKKQAPLEAHPLFPHSEPT
jgi:hypothetical protein